MTDKETAVVMDILTAAYPQFYSKQGPEEMDKALTLWATMFADDDLDLVLAALKALIATDTKGFPPHIGAVKEQMRKILNPHELGEGEAWALVSRALRNGIYGSKEEFAKLPPVVQRAVGSPDVLRDWAMSDEDVVGTVIASNFQRSYRAHLAHEHELQSLPDSVRQEITQLAGTMRMPALEEGERS